jgi:hypothetical protein
VSKGKKISWLAGGVIGYVSLARLMVLLGGPFSELYPMIPLPTNMAAIAENRKFDKKNHLKSSPLKLIWPIGRTPSGSKCSHDPSGQVS